MKQSKKVVAGIFSIVLLVFINLTIISINALAGTEGQNNSVEGISAFFTMENSSEIIMQPKGSALPLSTPAGLSMGLFGGPPISQLNITTGISETLVFHGDGTFSGAGYTNQSFTPTFTISSNAPVTFQMDGSADIGGIYVEGAANTLTLQGSGILSVNNANGDLDTWSTISVNVVPPVDPQQSIAFFTEGKLVIEAGASLRVSSTFGAAIVAWNGIDVFGNLFVDQARLASLYLGGELLVDAGTADFSSESTVIKYIDAANADISVLNQGTLKALNKAVLNNATNIQINGNFTLTGNSKAEIKTLGLISASHNIGPSTSTLDVYKKILVSGSRSTLDVLAPMFYTDSQGNRLEGFLWASAGLNASELSVLNGAKVYVETGYVGVSAIDSKIDGPGTSLTIYGETEYEAIGFNGQLYVDHQASVKVDIFHTRPVEINTHVAIAGIFAPIVAKGGATIETSVWGVEPYMLVDSPYTSEGAYWAVYTGIISYPGSSDIAGGVIGDLPAIQVSEDAVVKAAIPFYNLGLRGGDYTQTAIYPALAYFQVHENWGSGAYAEVQSGGKLIEEYTMPIDLETTFRDPWGHSATGWENPWTSNYEYSYFINTNDFEDYVWTVDGRPNIVEGNSFMLRQMQYIGGLLVGTVDGTSQQNDTRHLVQLVGTGQHQIIFHLRGLGIYDVSFYLEADKTGLVYKEEVVGGNTVQAVPPDPIKEGMIFKGWYLANGTKWEQSTPVNEHVEVFARWEPIVVVPPESSTPSSSTPSSSTPDESSLPPITPPSSSSSPPSSSTPGSSSSSPSSSRPSTSSSSPSWPNTSSTISSKPSSSSSISSKPASSGTSSAGSKPASSGSTSSKPNTPGSKPEEGTSAMPSTPPDSGTSSTGSGTGIVSSSIASSSNVSSGFIPPPTHSTPGGAGTPGGTGTIGTDNTHGNQNGSKSWGLLNLIIVVSMGLVSIYSTWALARTKKQKEIDYNDSNEETRKIPKHGKVAYAGGMLTFALGAVLFALFQDVRAKMLIIDEWTPLFVLTLVVFAIVAYLFFRKKEIKPQGEEKYIV